MDSFSFHCTICFEEFDSGERAPVTLPCGHTFICQQCSLRLDKCMTCRYPLLVPISGNGKYLSDGKEESHAAARQRHQRGNSLPTVLSNPSDLSIPKKSSVEKRPLPMPKNMVLISLMKSSRWSERDKNKKGNSFENQDEEVFIRKGIDDFNSDFGTYVVRDPEGLACGENFFKKETESYIVNDTKDDYDDDQSLDLNDAFGLNDTIVIKDSFGGNGHMSTEIALQETDEESKGKLKYGSTVQVVNFKDGVAKLARGEGNLEVSPGQLVKIGVAEDKACQLEGEKMSLNKRREEMKLKIKELDKEISNLSKELSKALALPFMDSVNAESSIEQANDISLDQKDNLSTATMASLSTTTTTSTIGTDASSSQNNFTQVTKNYNTASRQQVSQRQTSQSLPNSPARNSRGVDFSSGFSGYGFSGHRSPRRKPTRPIRRLSAY